jgi:hypothetical protein
MTDDYPIISADSHFVEPPDMYAERMQPKFRDQAPRMQRFTDEAGNEYDAWSIHGEQVGDIGRFVSAGYRFDEATVAQAWVTRPLWDEVPASAYDPHELVKALDEDGVWGACIQPTQGFGWFKVEDLELLSDICHASNDWIADFCAPYPDRLKGVGVINVRDVDRAVDEFHRCAERGIAAAFVPIWPADRERYDHPMYDPVFAAANETEIPLLMHIGAYGPHITGLERVIPANGKAPDMVAADRTVFDFYVRHSLAGQRLPALGVDLAEVDGLHRPHLRRRVSGGSPQARVRQRGPDPRLRPEPLGGPRGHDRLTSPPWRLGGREVNTRRARLLPSRGR